MRRDGMGKHSDSIMMNCQARQEELKAYLDGELPRVQRIAMWWHLLSCAECREARKAMTEISRRLAAGETNTLDPTLRARILASVTYTERPTGWAVPSRRRRLWNPLLLGGATAAGLVVILLLGPFQGRDAAKIGLPAASPPSFAPAATGSAAGNAVSRTTKERQPSVDEPKSPAQWAMPVPRRSNSEASSLQDSQPQKSAIRPDHHIPAPPPPISQLPAGRPDTGVQMSEKDAAPNLYINSLPHGGLAPAGNVVSPQDKRYTTSAGSAPEKMKNERLVPVTAAKSPARRQVRAQSRAARAKSFRVRAKLR